MRAKRGVASAAAMVLLAACTSSGHTTASTSLPTSSTSRAGVTTTSPNTAATGSTTTAPLFPALPKPATSGALHVSATIPFPLVAGTVAAAEAPDGAVFVALNTSPVYVIDGDQAAAVAEHVSGVQALAADAANLYAGTYTSAATTVFSYTRTTGSQIRQWSLPGINTANASNDHLFVLAVAGGALWATTINGNNVSVYRIDPGSGASPTFVATSLWGAAIGPDGSVYYERADTHLVRRAPTGQLTVGPGLANVPNSEGGGVQQIDTVAGGRLWVDQPAGQGLDAGYFTFDPVTLAATGGPFGGNLGEAGITDTLAGPLVLAQGNAVGVCPMPGDVAVECLFRMSTTAALSDQVVVGSGDVLLGPYPAVVASNAANTGLQLDRFS